MKKFSLCALSALVGSGLVMGFAPQTPVLAATLTSATLLVPTANGAVGDAGLGEAWGVDTTLVGTTRWTVFESGASNVITSDTNIASDIFVTNGTTVTRLSVAANGTEDQTLLQVMTRAFVLVDAKSSSPQTMNGTLPMPTVLPTCTSLTEMPTKTALWTNSAKPMLSHKRWSARPTTQRPANTTLLSPAHHLESSAMIAPRWLS